MTPEVITPIDVKEYKANLLQVKQFTAIINPPESAILALGTLGPEPVILDGNVAVRQRMRATLSVDHRVADGALAGQFLQDLKKALEAPESLFT